jgi:hypothetical protein
VHRRKVSQPGHLPTIEPEGLVARANESRIGRDTHVLSSADGGASQDK